MSDEREGQRPTDSGKEQRPRWSVLLGWSIYDLANTVFYLLVVTIYVPTYFAAESGHESAFVLAFVPAMFLSAFVSPAFGSLLRSHGRAKGATLALTALCCLGSSLLWLPVHWTVLALFYFGALFSYQMASVSYQSLLPVLAPASWVGRVSGIGVALGYLGNVVALLAISLLAVEQNWGVRWIFVLASALFLLFSLPLMLWVPRQPSPTERAPSLAEWRAEIRTTFQILRRNLDRPALRWFLLGNFLICDAINTVLVQIARYAEHDSGLGMSPDERSGLLVIVNVTAVLGAAVLGIWADRSSGKTVSLVSVGLLLGAIAGAEFLGVSWMRVGAISVLGGAGIAGVWTAGRLWLIQLVPRERTAEAFGLYGFTMKASLLSVLPFTWLVEVTDVYRTSIVLLLAMLAAGMLCWQRTARRASDRPT